MNLQWTGERLETFVFAETTLEHLHRYAFACTFVKGKIVLDIACGEGYGSNLLAQNALEVVGVDIDEETITKAAARYKKPNLKFLKGNATELPFGEKQFDVVVSFETIEHIGEHHKMLLEIKRVLKSEGLLIISTPDKKTYSDQTGYKNKFHIRELYKEEFAELIKNYFKNQIALQQNFICGSVLFESNSSFLQGYTGDFDRIYQRSIQPLYWVIVASHKNLDDVSASIFYDENFLNKLLQIQIENIKQTFTYRLGYFLLKPFKWLASFLRS